MWTEFIWLRIELAAEDSFKNIYEPSGYTNVGKLIDKMSNYELL
jgi:hypothetical protein